MTRGEFITAWEARGRPCCAACGHGILKVNSAMGYLYQNSDGTAQCAGRLGMHRP